MEEQSDPVLAWWSNPQTVQFYREKSRQRSQFPGQTRSDSLNLTFLWIIKDPPQIYAGEAKLA